MKQTNLSPSEYDELIKLKSQPASEASERALMVLMHNEGANSLEIANALRRNAHTVRDWIKRYHEKGVAGLYRNYSPGRPATLRKKIEQIVEKIIDRSPVEFGYPVSLWTALLIQDYLKKENIKASEDTIERALKRREYRYKRSAKTVPNRAPSKKEKKKTVSKMITKIKNEMKKGPYEVFALDESHFSTEPYVVSGWQKKLWPPQSSDSSQKREDVTVWMLEFPDKKILLEEFSCR